VQYTQRTQRTLMTVWRIREKIIRTAPLLLVTYTHLELAVFTILG